MYRLKTGARAGIRSGPERGNCPARPSVLAVKPPHWLTPKPEPEPEPRSQVDHRAGVSLCPATRDVTMSSSTPKIYTPLLPDYVPFIVL